jgi:hypothetical protein
MEHPAGIFGCWRGFRLGWRNSQVLSAERGSQMPLWVDVLLNVIGYGGFVAIAIYHRPSGDDLPTDER